MALPSSVAAPVSMRLNGLNGRAERVLVWFG